MARVWVIRGAKDNALVDEFIDAGVTGVGYYTVPDGTDLPYHEVLRCVLEEGESASPDHATAMFAAFVDQVAPGDVVVMPDTPRGDVVVGRVLGPYFFAGELPPERYRHRRTVKWLGRCAHAELPARWQNLYKQRQTLRELDAPELIAHADRMEGGEVGRALDDYKSRRAQSAVRKSVTAQPSEALCPRCGYLRPRSSFIDDLCNDCA